MISSPDMLVYSCIAKGATILGDFSNQEPGIESLASHWIEKAPPNHSMFSHTVRNRSYNFLMDDHFTYFVICSYAVDKPESIWFLHRLKYGFEKLLKNGSIKVLKNYSPRCFQSQFHSIIGEIRAMQLEFVFNLDLNLNLTVSSKSQSAARRSRDSRLDISSERRGIPVTPLLGKPFPLKGLKKKKRLPTETNRSKSPKDDVAVVVGARPAVDKKVDMGCDDNTNGKDSKIGLLLLHGNEKHLWRKHAMVVFILDLLVCVVVLFAIWLWICSGFQCIDLQ